MGDECGNRCSINPVEPGCHLLKSVHARFLILAVFILFLTVNGVSRADDAEPVTDESIRHWASITLDNDIFIGNDSGYSNGIYASLYEVADGDALPMAYLTRWLDWSVGKGPTSKTINGSVFGQVMVTPSDISTTAPLPDDIPYSGLMFFHQVSIQEFEGFADKSSITLGMLGPSSGAEGTQKLVHQLTGSDEPMGWDNQLKDELVFQVSRGRVWRPWHSGSEHFDLLWGGDVKLGTIESSVSAKLMFRVGNKMASSYSSVLLNEDRTTNPVNIAGGWYFYAGVSATRVFNWIYLDGNTFRNGPSVNYNPNQFDGVVGFAYGLEGFSVSIAVKNIDLHSEDDSFADVKEFGSLTFLWQI